jgi:hypothetical protein
MWGSNRKAGVVKTVCLGIDVELKGKTYARQLHSTIRPVGCLFDVRLVVVASFSLTRTSSSPIAPIARVPRVIVLKGLLKVRKQVYECHRIKIVYCSQSVLVNDFVRRCFPLLLGKYFYDDVALNRPIHVFGANK